MFEKHHKHQREKEACADFSIPALSSALPGESKLLQKAAIKADERDLQAEKTPMFDREDKNKAINNWNRAVNLVFGKVIDALSERGL